jgi:hypothetical protein
MPKKPKKMRIGVTLPPKTASRLNAYCIKKATKNGKITTHLPSKIGRKAIEEWLDNHENDLTIDFE